MQNIPVQAVPNQTLTVLLASQNTKLKIYTLADGNLYMDVLVNDAAIVTGVICQDKNRIIRDVYLGYVGDFVFIDSQGDSDPDYSNLGTRYQLFYLSAADIAALTP